ncbi:MULTISPECIES: AAA family ATPase [Bacillaceae]|nr:MULTISPECIES: AAA family ATPase [Bacillaceae]MCF7621773.1 AAA family ATPase [Peribacillus frigoritolerans]
MKDQAENLRRRLEARQNQSMAKTIAILSGKGGVGKSNFSLNFSIALSQSGKKVLLFDMDIGMGNLDILIGEHSPCSIIDFFEKECRLKDIIMSGPGNISIITGGTGMTNLFSLDEDKYTRFNAEFSLLLANYDYILFDMGAGMTEDSMKFLLCVDELVVITTPEPTSIMDAYSAMKYIHSVNKEIPFFLVCNRVF